MDKPNSFVYSNTGKLVKLSYDMLDIFFDLHTTQLIRTTFGTRHSEDRRQDEADEDWDNLTGEEATELRRLSKDDTLPS